MSVDAPAGTARTTWPFRHEALMYRGEAEFLDATSSFITAGVVADEPVLVVVSEPKIEKLKDRLGPDADRVLFADMAEVGKNPVRIIPAWSDFVADFGGDGRGLRGIGEPIDAGRSPAQLAECHRHETLLNLAFAGGQEWWLLCPYDVDGLDPSIVEEARRTHPYVAEGGAHVASPQYAGLDVGREPFRDPLPEPPAEAVVSSFTTTAALGGVRRDVAGFASAAGLPVERVEDVVVAANEVATNSLRHGGGRGTLRMWRDGAGVVIEVSDRGQVHDALVGRQRPPHANGGGRGLWLANQLCDLVQLRSFPGGTVVRLHMSA